MRCSKCGAEKPDRAKFCAECASPFTHRCSSCYTENSLAAKFCIEFLPFVNLHQEHYRWPDSKNSGQCALFGYQLGLRGSLVRYYLWLQVISGWLLSATFVAGLTGLMRSD